MEGQKEFVQIKDDVTPDDIAVIAQDDDGVDTEECYKVDQTKEEVKPEPEAVESPQ